VVWKETELMPKPHKPCISLTQYKFTEVEKKHRKIENVIPGLHLREGGKFQEFSQIDRFPPCIYERPATARPFTANTQIDHTVKNINLKHYRKRNLRKHIRFHKTHDLKLNSAIQKAQRIFYDSKSGIYSSYSSDL
jgi:hypothetical protein